MKISDIAGVIMDMDGVLWRGDEVLPGAARWLQCLQRQGIPCVMATNNATKTPADYVEKFDRLGLPRIEKSHIITSGSTTADYLQRHYPLGTPVFVVGPDALRALIEAAGMVVTEDAAVVVAGLDMQLSYARLRQAALLIRAGAAFVGTNPDRTLPTPQGLVPGAGSIIAALEAATDQQPILMGKPHRPMFDNALEILKTTPQQTLMIGDRMDTDIFGAQQLGMQTALVLTGVSTRADAEAETPPNAIFDDLETLTDGILNNA